MHGIIKHNVEAQHFKAHIVRHIVGLTGLVVVWERLLDSQQGLNDHIFDFLENIVNLQTLVLYLVFEPF